MSRAPGRVWSVSFRTEANCVLVAEVRTFFTEHGVPFAETAAFGLIEFAAGCSEEEVPLLIGALQRVATRQLLKGEATGHLLTARPAGVA